MYEPSGMEAEKLSSYFRPYLPTWAEFICPGDTEGWNPQVSLLKALQERDRLRGEAIGLRDELRKAYQYLSEYAGKGRSK